MTQQLPIPALLVAILTLLENANAVAQTVQAPNFELGMMANEVDTADSTSTGSVGAHASGTLPLGSYLGVSLSANYLDSSVRTRGVLVDAGAPTNGSRSSCSFDSTHGDISLFARKPTLGRVAVSYGLGRLSASCGDDAKFVWTGDDTLKTRRYGIEAEIYLRDFTLGASRVSNDLEDGPTLETTSITASWYPLDSLRISMSGNDLYDQNTYGFVLEHQPEFMGNSVGAYVGYASTDQSPRTRTLSLGITYYFGTSVELKQRDREYR